jgi:threonylcarbamoyladenosine tRNA methylthiotransferase MtaB
MKRNYTVKEYIEKVEKIMSKRPETAIGTDIITGFPTEDKTAFLNTVKTTNDIPFAYIHVFTYSERDGTTAVKFGDKVHPEEKKERTKILREISYQKNYEFRKRFMNKDLEFLIISERDDYKIGITGNYIHAKIKTEKPVNTIIKANLKEIGREREENTAVEV